MSMEDGNAKYGFAADLEPGISGLRVVDELEAENELLRASVKSLQDALFVRRVDQARMTELLKKEKYMRLLLESSPEIIMLLDGDGLIEYCTDKLLRLVGIESFDVIAGKSFRELYAMFGDEEFVERGTTRFQSVKNRVSIVSNDVEIDFSGHGKGRMYNVQASPMLDDGGNLYGVLVMYYDTTDVRKAESEESARVMLDATPLACSLWNENGDLMDCNNEALRMYGLSGKSDYLKYLDALSPKFQPDGRLSLEKAEQFERAAIETGFQQFEWMHLTLSGEELPVETTLVRVELNDGYRLATYSRDLRAFKANERLARDADARRREMEVRSRAAQVASEAKSRFLASMSHEIRTPMNAIIGMSDLMRTDNLDATQRGYFDDIRKMSRALLQIINDILDFSKIEAGKMELVNVHFNLMELYDNVVSMSRFMAGTKELEFRYSFGTDVPHVIYGDDARVRQIIVNVVNNAIKYTRDGSVDFSVKRASKNGRDYIAFIVKDTGIGISDEDMPKLFSSFRQFDGEANRGIVGTGLGLSITNNLLTLMDGEISVESEYGEGSTFTVLLPLVEGDPAMVKTAELAEFSMATDDVRVLVVDDNQINLKVAVAYLARHNVRTDTAESGVEAIRKVREKRYDMIFMDHMMPVMDGIETTKRIRCLPGVSGAPLPIIALTANAVAGARESFIEAGMNDFVTKPIDPKALNSVLLKWLPPDKVKCAAETGKEGSLAQVEELAAHSAIDAKEGLRNAAGDEELYRQLRENFVEDHASDYERISDALDSDDPEVFSKAMLLAHTLKSTAALIGASGLRAAVFAIERKLTNRGVPTAEHLQTFRNELDAVLSELGRPEKKRRSANGELDRESALALVEKLEPLLKSGNASSLDLLDEIDDVLSPLGDRVKELAERIGDFEFYAALETLTSMKAALLSTKG
ncbi:MAG: response regulator [Synergistaceae bacterium]|jgi:PAS domain S-box-containing protein|nr:response regulator [Synergistaceae bacterium]